MTHQQARIVASVLSGRVDIADLSFEARGIIGIMVDPKHFRDESLRCVEDLLVRHLERNTIVQCVPGENEAY